MDKESEKTKKFDRSSSSSRWLLLCLACIVMLGSYYSYDNPSALKKQLCARFDPTLSDFQFNMMYSVYSFPNIVLPLLGGYFVDRLGTSVTLITFASLIMCGQAVFAIGVGIRNYGLTLVGRVLFGFGGESLGVAQSTLLATWFRGKEMAFAMGLALSISRLGSVVNDYVSPAIYNASSVPYALWFGFLVCAFSVVSAICIWLVDRWATNQVKATEVAAPADQPKGPAEDEQIRLSDIKEFSTLFWLLCVGCFVVYGTILPFNNIAGDFLQDRFDYDTDTADRIMSIPFFISAALCPFLGGSVDKWGNRAVLQTVSAGAIVLVHTYFFATHWTPYPPLVLLGLSYAIYAAAIWPSVPLVVEKRAVGTAYGLVNSIQNFGLAFIPLINGAIKDDAGSYHYVELFFLLLGCIGVTIGLVLNYVDSKYNGGLLNRAHKKKEDEASESEKAAAPAPEYAGSSQGTAVLVSVTDNNQMNQPLLVNNTGN